MMTEERAQGLASLIESEDHRVIATPRTKPEKSRDRRKNTMFYVHVLLKYGQRQAYVYNYDGWDSLRQAWSTLQ